MPVSVEDTGPGIQDEVKGKLFTRFERGMARGRGEGLGLFIVRTLVERYGGKVRVEDRVPGHHGCRGGVPVHASRSYAARLRNCRARPCLAICVPSCAKTSA